MLPTDALDKCMHATAEYSVVVIVGLAQPAMPPLVACIGVVRQTAAAAGVAANRRDRVVAAECVAVHDVGRLEDSIVVWRDGEFDAVRMADPGRGDVELRVWTFGMSDQGGWVWARHWLNALEGVRVILSACPCEKQGSSR